MRWLALGVALLLGAGLATWSQEVTGRGQARSAPPQPGKPRWEYKALSRLDLLQLAPKPKDEAEAREPGKVFLRLADPALLSIGLNSLADQGWELVAIEPYFQLKEQDFAINYGPTYVFKREK